MASRSVTITAQSAFLHAAIAPQDTYEKVRFHVEMKIVCSHTQTKHEGRAHRSPARPSNRWNCYDATAERKQIQRLEHATKPAERPDTDHRSRDLFGQSNASFHVAFIPKRDSGSDGSRVSHTSATASAFDNVAGPTCPASTSWSNF